MCSNKIITYDDYYHDAYEYTKHGMLGDIKIRDDKMPNDIKKFFAIKGFCPFCNKKMMKVYDAYESDGNKLFTNVDIWECDDCGWWEVLYRFSEEDDWIDKVNEIRTDDYYYGVAKIFSVDDKKIPLNVLTDELQKKRDIIYNISPYKLEELVKNTLSEFFSCDVHHVGQTGDGGVDLIVVNSDDPILVQVKRRENPRHVELVNYIREFIGALYINDCRKGIYVTTAKDYSKASKEVAKTLLDNRRLDYFELINYDKLFAMINFKNLTIKPWMQFTEKFKMKHSYQDNTGKMIDSPAFISAYKFYEPSSNSL